jgi:hypothetical protein
MFSGSIQRLFDAAVFSGGFERLLKAGCSGRF